VSTLRTTLIPLLFAGLALACGASQGGRNLSYGDNAREAYAAAMEDFRGGDCLNAEPAFRKLRRKYSYTRYAALSELRIADCMLEQDKHTEAIAAYRRFVRNRPSHGEVPYARFKIAEAYFKQVPDEWLLSPPAHERDQGPTREALRQLRRFILDFPDDGRLGEANQMVRRSLDLLAHHELYVAEFYLDRDHPQAAILRLTTLLETYRGSGIVPQAMLLLGRTHLSMSDQGAAREAFQELVERFPESGYADQARGYLARL